MLLHLSGGRVDLVKMIIGARREFAVSDFLSGREKFVKNDDWARFFAGRRIISLHEHIADPIAG